MIVSLDVEPCEFDMVRVERRGGALQIVVREGMCPMRARAMLVPILTVDERAAVREVYGRAVA